MKLRIDRQLVADAVVVVFSFVLSGIFLSGVIQISWTALEQQQGLAVLEKLEVVFEAIVKLLWLCLLWLLAVSSTIGGILIIAYLGFSGGKRWTFGRYWAALTLMLIGGLCFLLIGFDMVLTLSIILWIPGAFWLTQRFLIQLPIRYAHWIGRKQIRPWTLPKEIFEDLFAFEPKHSPSAERARTNTANAENDFSYKALVFSFTFVLGSWITYSALVLLITSPPLLADSRNLRPLRNPAHADRPWDRLRVGVALSGGGYRAAVLHAGVLQELSVRGANITYLSTVSGGSIVGAFYALGGQPDAFRQAAVDGRFNLKASLLNFFNMIRLPAPLSIPGIGEAFPFWKFDRVHVQAQLLGRFFSGTPTSANCPRCLCFSLPPQTLIAATPWALRDKTRFLPPFLRSL